MLFQLCSVENQKGINAVPTGYVLLRAHQKGVNAVLFYVLLRTRRA